MLKILYYLYFFLISVPLLLVVTVFVSILTGGGSIVFGGKWWGYYPPKIWAKIFCILTFVRVKVEAKEKFDERKSYVFVANHQGAYDIFAIYGYLGHNFKWMMKKSLEKIPLIGFACRRAGHIFVDNSGVGAIKGTMRKAEQELKGGMSIVVFPEGSRTKTGKMSRFKRGAFQLAQEFSLPIVPITINGAFEVMPRTAFLPFYGTITLKIHDAIPAPGDEADIKDKISEAYAAVYSGLDDKYKD